MSRFHHSSRTDHMKTSPRSPRLPASPLAGTRPPANTLPQSNTSNLLSPSRQRQPQQKTKMTLSGLPRYHPATYSSPSNSSISSPDMISSDGAPLSPHTLNARRSEAQRQLYLYQRELASFAYGASGSSSTLRSSRPASPKLNPVAMSPGAVTPLELEQADGYLLAGHNPCLDDISKEHIVQRLIEAESGQLQANTKPTEAYIRSP